MKWILAAVLILVSALILNILVRVLKKPDAVLNIDYYADGPQALMVNLHPLEYLKSHKRMTVEIRTRNFEDRVYSEETDE